MLRFFTEMLIIWTIINQIEISLFFLLGDEVFESVVNRKYSSSFSVPIPIFWIFSTASATALNFFAFSAAAVVILTIILKFSSQYFFLGF